MGTLGAVRLGAGAVSRPFRSWRPLSCFAVFGLFWGTWGALLPAVKAQTGATEAQLGLALLALAAAALPAMLSSGWLIDRLRDRALAPMAGAFGIAVVLPGLAHSPLALGASVVAVGAASGALDVTMNASVATEEERRGTRLMHAAHAVFSGGVVVAAISVGLARSVGAGPLLVLAVVSAVVVLVALGIHTARREQPDRERTSTTSTPGGGHLLLSIPLLLLGGLCALAYLVENALQSWSALHLEQSLGAGPAIGGLGPAFFAGAAGLGRLGAQGVAARVQDRLLIGSAAVVGAVGSGDYLGFLLGPAMVGTIADVLSLRLALASVAAVAMLLAILARYVPRPSQGSRP